MIITYPARWRASTVALCVAAAAVTATALAAPARADQYDFVSMFDNEGVYYSSITDVIDQGKMVCRMLRNGAGMPAPLDYAAGGGYAPYETAVVVASPAMHMCPDVLPTVRAFLGGGSATGA
ncbi:DUF732 domain-containing protein [Mycolicibacterium smegmatis]|uniref:DUF732 domain-containing protein n=2 Tax=Mycolicibacterium smegmatis (strain ATCC 700084 / mc(2)155) TaxID=246196 RepID=A0QRV4_MYCS2|nr:DUF732 domain-containing protein [Mycolicibacterium smegmatis]ABK74180.1 conserved hypothetical protein [Mycolicibacterium smegmatis MC2 155]AFP37692.1 hypothetical protein MSMEI_1216 [Mycolicibacterium smegmatis MC2 155]AIU06496.1 hypothetical protein LJ00_06235 [Mycolicibacterium smegmatis MC2 155]AIU13121.1 hypothetical protein LI99_06235 [Mycolicibacterium smegmatis]AIU19745.1 hypothetical protein LI98_06235 [Mycolicibacterium smegmatis]